MVSLPRVVDLPSHDCHLVHIISLVHMSMWHLDIYNVEPLLIRDSRVLNIIISAVLTIYS